MGDTIGCYVSDVTLIIGSDHSIYSDAHGSTRTSRFGAHELGIYSLYAWINSDRSYLWKIVRSLWQKKFISTRDRNFSNWFSALRVIAKHDATHYFRALQGIGGGAMMVNSFAIIGEVFPPAERGKYQGMIGGVFGLSSIAGPLLGGWITDHVSWRWVFYVNIPLGIVALFVLSTTLPKIVAHSRDKKIDWWGGFFIIATLVPLLLSVVWGGSVYSWTSAIIIGSLLLSFISLFIFLRIERKTRNPILSLDLLRTGFLSFRYVLCF